MNIDVHVSLRIIVVFGYMSRSGIARSFGNYFKVHIAKLIPSSYPLLETALTKESNDF